MTEAEWLTSAQPELMLESLRGKASDRKLRLFATACCRRIWRLVTDERSRQAIVIAEQYADHNFPESEVIVAREAAAFFEAEADDSPEGSVAYAAAASAYATTYPKRWRLESHTEAARSSAADACFYENFRQTGDEDNAGAAEEAEMRSQCGLLRDIFGNPLRPVLCDSDSPILTLMARSIYDGGSFSRMPELADALQQAGCSNPAILEHCRGPGPHVRGCWVLDLTLGKS